MTTHRPPGRSQAFVDTGAYYALTDAKDPNHTAARSIATRVGKERWRLFTTNMILAETHALVLARVGRGVALRVLQEIDRSAVTVVRVTPDDENRAREILVTYDDKNFSLTDATSFVVMERLSTPYAFTFDKNFHQYGLEVLKPE